MWHETMKVGSLWGPEYTQAYNKKSKKGEKLIYRVLKYS